MKNDKQMFPEIRFPGFTGPWEQRKLSDLYQDIGNAFVGTATPYYVDKGHFYLESNNVKDGQINHNSEIFINDEFYEKQKDKWLRTGDMVMVQSGHVGHAAVIPEELDNSAAHALIMFRNPKTEIDPYFLNYQYQTSKAKQKIDNITTGNTIKHILASDMQEFIVDMTSCEEQAKIADLFRCLDDTITLHQRKCDELKNYKKGLLQQMFPLPGESTPRIRFPGFTDPWEQRKVGELVKDHNAGIYISKDKYGEGTNVIGVGNIYDSDIFDGEIYRLGPVDDDKFLLEEGDLIYGESSLVLEGIARTVCVGKNGAGSAFAWHTRRVKLDKTKVDSHFATLELNYHPVVRKYLMSVATQTALTGMTTDGYFSAPLFLPSIQEQRKISAIFKSIDNLITLHQRKCDELKTYKKGLLQKMFV